MYYDIFRIPFTLVVSSQNLIKHKQLSVVCSSFGKVVKEFDAPLTKDIIIHLPLGPFTMDMMPVPRSKLSSQYDEITLYLTSKRLMELIQSN